MSLAQIVTPKVPSGITLEILREHKSGALDQNEYRLMNVGWISDNASSYRPQPFPEFPQSVETYARARISERMEYESENSKRLGTWIAIIITIRERNLADYGLLTWALHIAREKAPGIMQPIETAISMHQQNRYPIEALDLALRVQRLDSEAKQSRERR